MIQRLGKDFKQQEEKQCATINELNTKEKGAQTRETKIHDGAVGRKSICEQFQKYTKDDAQFVASDLHSVHSKLLSVYDAAKYIDKQLRASLGSESNVKTSEKTSISLLTSIERRVFFLLDLIDCLPREPVEVKVAEIEKKYRNAG